MRAPGELPIVGEGGFAAESTELIDCARRCLLKPEFEFVLNIERNPDVDGPGAGPEDPAD